MRLSPVVHRQKNVSQRPTSEHKTNLSLIHLVAAVLSGGFQ
jgi:hypothetical protein